MEVLHCFERALSLEPGNADAREALGEVRALIEHAAPRVRCDTTAGPLHIQLLPEVSPRGVARVVELVGPFASKKAGWDVAEGELFEPVVSRGLWANAIFLVTMALFAYLNLLCCVVEAVGERVAPKWVESLRSA